MKAMTWAAAFLLAAATPAMADFTTVIDPPAGSLEPSLSSLLTTIYGGGTTFSRIDDFSPAYDAAWLPSGGGTGVTVEAKHAGYSQHLGYNDASGSYDVLKVTGQGTSPTVEDITTHPATYHAFSPVGVFTFTNDPNGPSSPPGVWNSTPGANSDGLDHMITFEITNGSQAGNYVIAWDDQVGGGDRDFNDLVIEVSGVVPVPEPATLLLLGSGVAGLAAYTRRRRNRAKA